MFPTFVRARVALILLVLVAVTAQGCRTPRRSVRVGGDAATLKVQMGGLDQAALGRTDWLYELSGCVPVLNGALEGSDLVVFKAMGLKKGLAGCQLRVRLLNSTPGISFAAGTEPNVLFWARELIISQDAGGHLVAKAPLQKLFTIAPSAQAKKNFTLKVPVKFKLPEAGTPMTAALTCTPLIANIGLYPDGNPVEGEFTFAVAIDQETPFKCTEMQVGIAGTKRRYSATFEGGSVDIQAVPDQTVTTAALELELQEGPDGDGGGVQVEVESKDCNSDGKIFDTATKECVDKPAAN